MTLDSILSILRALIDVSLVWIIPSTNLFILTSLSPLNKTILYSPSTLNINDFIYSSEYLSAFSNVFIKKAYLLIVLWKSLITSYRLLESNGMFWIHLDDVEVHYCKVVLDEIFSRHNFASHITYERSAVAGLGQGGYLVNTTEHILLYKKGVLPDKVNLSYEELGFKVLTHAPIILDEYKLMLSHVPLPDAKIKIFLTASAEARADRRFKELQEKGQDVQYDVILKEIKERDYQDMNRATAPLKQAEDAVLVDTTEIGLDESIELMINTIKERL